MASSNNPRCSRLKSDTHHQFRRLFNGQDQVARIGVGLPDRTNYEYDLFEPMAVHMEMASKQHVIGMYKSIEHHQTQRVGTLAMIPKKTNTPIDDQMGEEGWGLHAVQGYTLSKILVWIAALTILGLVFVILWLLLVDKTDLQNAFVPATFLSTMAFIGLAIPQILGVA